MLVAPRIENYLNETHTNYDVVHHGFTNTAYDSACSAHLSSKSVVKAVILRDTDDGKYVVAVIPASHKLKLSWVDRELNRRMELAEEIDMPQLFDDCLLGAIPGFAQAYGIELIWDDRLSTQSNLYFESGSHQDLIRITNKQFTTLFKFYPHATISTEKTHFWGDHSDVERFE